MMDDTTNHIFEDLLQDRGYKNYHLKSLADRYYGPSAVKQEGLLCSFCKDSAVEFSTYLQNEAYCFRHLKGLSHESA